MEDSDIYKIIILNVGDKIKFVKLATKNSSNI